MTAWLLFQLATSIMHYNGDFRRRHAKGYKWRFRAWWLLRRYSPPASYQHWRKQEIFASAHPEVLKLLSKRGELSGSGKVDVSGKGRGSLERGEDKSGKFDKRTQCCPSWGLFLWFDFLMRSTILLAISGPCLMFSLGTITEFEGALNFRCRFLPIS